MGRDPAQDRLNDLAPGSRNGNSRSGRWVSVALARPAAGGFDDPVVVSVFDGEFAPLDDAEPIDVNGGTFRTVQIGAWQALATNALPTLLAEGAVPVALLADVMSAARITTNGTDVSVVLDSVPDGFEIIVPPQALGDDTTPRRTLASRTNMLVINEVSDWIDPLLYAAGTGTDIQRLEFGESIGWTGTTNERIPLTFLVWSPEPGTLLEITTTDPDRPIADLVALAEQTEAAPIADWESAYPD